MIYLTVECKTFHYLIRTGQHIFRSSAKTFDGISIKMVNPLSASIALI